MRTTGRSEVLDLNLYWVLGGAKPHPWALRWPMNPEDSLTANKRNIIALNPLDFADERSIHGAAQLRCRLCKDQRPLRFRGSGSA